MRRLAIIAIVALLIVTLIWILSALGIISSSIATICSILVTMLSVVFAAIAAWASISPNIKRLRQQPTTGPLRRGSVRTRLVRLLIILAILVVALFGSYGIWVAFFPHNPCYATHLTELFPPSNGIDAHPAQDGTCIGLSEGSFVFDTNRQDTALKQQAAAQLQAGHLKDAKPLLDQAIQMDPTDAEAQIYRENLRIILNGSPYITLVIATTFTTDYIGNAHDNLQGAYVAQYENNEGCHLTDCYKIRLLIANAGGNVDNTTAVAQQIVAAAKVDPTIVGVMGWPLSKYTAQAITVLAGSNIPMVSPSSSDDNLFGTSRYFFGIATKNQSEADVAAQYAATQLRLRTVAIFYDPSDSFSMNLHDDFVMSSTLHNLQIVDTETFTAGDSGRTLSGKLQNALQQKPELLYFAGHAKDAKTLFASLPPCSPSYCPTVMGSNSLYVLENSGGYPPETKGRLYFTAYAFPDEWGVKPENPPFFLEYCEDFAPDVSLGYCGEKYGSTRAEGDVIVSYDATRVLLTASSKALQIKLHVRPDDIQRALTKIAQFQGISGCISFNLQGEATGKTVLVLSVDSLGKTHMVSPESYTPKNLRC